MKGRDAVVGATIICGVLLITLSFIAIRNNVPAKHLLLELPQAILADPALATCPTSNCPSPPSPPVLSSLLVHGSTTKGSRQPEWLSNIGLFVKSGAPDGQKVAQYIGVMQQQGAGTAWALNTDLVRNAGHGSANSFGGFEGSGQPGAPGAIGVHNGSIGYELDFTNWDADSSPGRGAFTVGQYVHAQSTYMSLAALYFDATMAASNTKAGWADGILFNGDRVVADNTFFDGTHSTHSLTIAGHHVVGLNTFEANADMRAIQMRPGQTACFNGTSNCFTWRDGRLAYTNQRGETVFSVDEDGNAAFKGRVTSR